jgi:hypothetical protein
MDLAAVGPALDELASSATEVEVVGEVHRETKEVDGSEQQDALGGKLSERWRKSANWEQRVPVLTLLWSGLRSKCRQNPAFFAYFGSNVAEFPCS